MTPDFTIALSDLLSSLYTDAEMALADEWDRADEGFATQINMIEAFATRFHIPLYNPIERAETDDAVAEDLSTQPSLQTVSSAPDTAPDHAALALLDRAWHDRFNWLWNQLSDSAAWNEADLEQVHQLADEFDQVMRLVAVQPVAGTLLHPQVQVKVSALIGQDYYPVKRDGHGFAAMGLTAVPDIVAALELHTIALTLHPIGATHFKVKLLPSLDVITIPLSLMALAPSRLTTPTD